MLKGWRGYVAPYPIGLFLSRNLGEGSWYVKELTGLCLRVDGVMLKGWRSYVKGLMGLCERVDGYMLKGWRGYVKGLAGLC